MMISDVPRTVSACSAARFCAGQAVFSCCAGKLAVLLITRHLPAASTFLSFVVRRCLYICK